MATATTTISTTVANTGDKAATRDFRQEVTDTIIQMLENGTAPWQKPWEPGANALSVPFNPTSERAYRGGNAIHLMATALRNGYEDPRWMTYKQAADQGWQVRRGEKGTQTEFWEVRPANRDDQTNGAADAGAEQAKRGTERSKPIHRVYTVFNARQIDNIPDYTPASRTEFEVVHAGEQILTNSGAKIAHDQPDRAYYSRSQDSIHLPPRAAFKEPAGFYGTALHELSHWTGHPSRLNRPTLNESYRFGDLNYAKEELRAELASVFLAAERGIPHEPEQHAAYVGSWIKALKEDRNEIFRAAHDASAATDFLLALERDRSIADDEITTDPSIDQAAGVSEAARLDQTATDLQHDRERLDEVEQTPPPPSRLVLAEAQAVTASVLGPKAKALAAQAETGTYRGPIIGETDQFVVQRQSSRFSVAHQKALLDKQPEAGETVSINYAGGTGTVREYTERSRSQERQR